MNKVVISLLVLSALALPLADSAAQSVDKQTPPVQKNGIYHQGLNCWVPAGISAGLMQTPAPQRVPGSPAGASRSNMTIVKSFGFPAGWLYARDIAWDGSYLWMGENFNSRIYKLDPANGAVISNFYAPGSNPWGLA